MTHATAEPPAHTTTRPHAARRRGLWRAAMIVAAMLALGAGLHRARQSQLDSALAAAVKAGQRERVRALLARGADPNAREGREQLDRDDRDFWQQMLALIRPSVRPTVLQRACMNDDARLATMLIEHGADVNARGPGATTALQVACMKVAAPCIALLVAHGANVNARQADGCTPLHFLVAHGGATEVRLLLDHGADPRVRDNDGLDALAYARDAGRGPEVMALLQRAAAGK